MNCTEADYVETITELHKIWVPHPGQIRVGKPLINGQVKDLFIVAGRNWGKTEFMAYLLWRWARLHPGSENYYFAPFMKQAREILWASQRLQGFGPKYWLKGQPNSTEMRITFNNGSFIKLDGSDNYEAYRGVKPRGLSIYDEYKDFRPEFHEAYDPNRAAHDSPLAIIGTPPDRENHFTELMALYQKANNKAYFEAPSAENPHIKREWLESKKAEFILKGELEVWIREYEAKFVKGGKAKIFPMLNGSTHITEHGDLMRALSTIKSKCEWYTISDPAASSVFGMLFAAINRHTKKIYLLDEIYETSQAEMRVQAIGTEMLKKEHELHQYGQEEWSRHYDEAESWFANEMQDRFELNWFPTQKALNKKANGLSLIKDLLLSGQLVMSSRCEKLYWEMDNYFKDKNGNIPKEHDHLIDCLRYLLAAAGYQVAELKEVKEKDNENILAYRIEDDFPEINNEEYD